MIKTRTIKVKIIENEEIILAMTMTIMIITTIIMKIIAIIMMRMNNVKNVKIEQKVFK